jgi:hypothetical protein
VEALSPGAIMISESAYLPCSADVAITIVYQTSQLCLIAHSVNVFRNPYQVEFSVEVEKGHIMLLRRPVTSIFPIFLILSSLFIAACGSSPSASSGGSGTQPVTLNWFMWSGSPQEVQAWQYDASLVTKKYPWIHINFQTASWTDYWTKLESEAATGNSLTASFPWILTSSKTSLMSPLSIRGLLKASRIRALFALYPTILVRKLCTITRRCSRNTMSLFPLLIGRTLISCRMRKN